MTQHTTNGIHGHNALAASRAYRPGEVVLRLEGARQGAQSRTSIQIYPGMHIEHELGAIVNHSCKPSCSIENGNIVAIVPIRTGAEITIDYKKTESPLSNPFNCACCGEWIEQ